QMGATLDLDQMARGLINIVVPHFGNSAGLLLLESLVAADEPPVSQGDGSSMMRRMAIATDDSNPDWDATFPTGEVLRYPAGSPYTECMRTGRPVPDDHRRVGRTGRIVAAAARGQPAVRIVLPAAAAQRPRLHTGLHRVHPAQGVPLLRRLRHRDRHGVRLPGGDLRRQRAAV